MTSRRALLLAGGAAAAAAIVIRLPYLGVPLDADEGGYAYLARRWAEGGRLYGPVWVDRPQGLMLLYRLVADLGRGGAWIRLTALGLALLLAVGVSSAAWALSGRRAALIAAVLVAVAGSAPHLQGFMLNGELAAGAFSAVAVASALWARRTGRLWLLALAGAAGAVAVLMKQSGFDGAVVAFVLTVGWRRLRATLAFAAGLAGPLGLALLHAALTSWSDWWYAVVGYRLDTSAGSRGGLSGRWHNIAASWPHLWPDLLVLAGLVLVGLVWCLFGRGWVPALWLVVALTGFAGGVFFFPHYWMQLVGPACLLGALALAVLPARIAVAGTVLACLPAVWFFGAVAVGSPDHRDRIAVPDHRLLANREIAPWLRAHAAPGDRLYAFVSSADLYWTTGLPTGFRYLWQANLDAIPGSVPQLQRYLAGPQRPQWVVVYAQPDALDPSGTLARTLAAGYRPVTVIDGVPVLHSR